MDIPSGVLAQFSDSVDRTGLTLALARAYDVFHTLFTLPPDLVEDLFWIQGQADCTGNVIEDWEEVEVTR